VKHLSRASDDWLCAMPEYGRAGSAFTRLRNFVRANRYKGLAASRARLKEAALGGRIIIRTRKPKSEVLLDFVF
jgi:hypothetical protein